MMDRPTLPWNLELPERITESQKYIYTPFSKKITYDGYTFTILYHHNWHCGKTIPVCSYDEKEKKSGVIASMLRTEFLRDNCQSCSKCGNCCSEKLNIGKATYRRSYEVIDGMAVVRFFKMVGHMPKENETQNFVEYKRIFIFDNKIWSEYPSEEKVGKKFYWEESNYKRGIGRLFGSVVKFYDTTDFYEFFAYVSKNLNDCFFHPSARVAIKTLPTYPKNDKFQRTVDKYNEVLENFLSCQNVNFFDNIQFSDEEYEIVKNKTQFNARLRERDGWHYEISEKAVNPIFKYALTHRLNEKLVVVRLFQTSPFDVNKKYEYARFFIDDVDFYPCYYHNGRVSRCQNIASEFWTSNNAFEIPTENTIIEKKYNYVGSMSKNNLLLLLLSKRYLWIEQICKIIPFGDRICDEFYEKEHLLAAFSYKFFARKRDFYYNYRTTGKVDIKRNCSLYERFDKKDFKLICMMQDLIKNPDGMALIVQAIDDIKSSCENSAYEIIKLMKENCLDIDSINYCSETLTILKDYIKKEDMFFLAKSIIKQFAKLDSFRLIGSAKDTYRMICQNYEENYSEMFKMLKNFTKKTTRDEIFNTHDTMMLINKSDKNIDKQFERAMKHHQKLEYEDDKYLIRLPKNSGEVISEGNKMHHCVGGYINTIINNQSVIMFMRKKDRPEKEYVTVEVGVRNTTLKQVKCKGNNSLSSVSALGFIEKWISEKNIDVRTSDIEYNNGTVTVTQNPWHSYLLEEDSVLPEDKKNKGLTDENIEDCYVGGGYF